MVVKKSTSRTQDDHQDSKPVSKKLIASMEAIDLFCDTCWLEDGLSKNSLSAYRRDLLLFARWLVNSKYGRVLQAVRDAESRVMFCGYSTLQYKLTIWTISAMMCGVAGALYVPQVGIINPSEMSPANSIEIAIWTAVGGRGTLIGPIAGAFIVNGAKSWLTVVAPSIWLYFLGLLFVAVTLYMPGGVVGLIQQLSKKLTGGKK
jgi:urea transport system permease protein